MDDTQNRTENDAIIDAMKELAEPRTLELHRGSATEAQVLLAPKGFTLHQVKPLLDEYLPKPERRRGMTALTDPSSFIAFVNRSPMEKG